MKTIKLSKNEIDSLLLLFLLGSSVVVGLNLDTEENAWLVNLGAMLFGVGLFFFYTFLVKKSGWLPFDQLLELAFGKVLAKIILLLYSLYFLYIASRVVKDFSYFISQTLFYEIEDFVISFVLVSTIVYAATLGLEAVARTSQILLFFTFILLFLIILFSFISDLMYLENIRPLVDIGALDFRHFYKWITFPYGEIVVFLFIFPLVNDRKKLLKSGWIPIVVSGMILILLSEIIIGILGAKVAALYTLPVVKAIEMINLMEVIQHLEFLSVFSFLFVGFVKVSIFFVCSTEVIHRVVPIFQSRFLIVLFGVLLFFLSIYIADDLSHHLHIGLEIVPLYLHVPFQFVIPLAILVMLVIKKRRVNNKEGVKA